MTDDRVARAPRGNGSNDSWLSGGFTVFSPTGLRANRNGEAAAVETIKTAARERNARAEKILEHQPLSRTDPAVEFGDFRIGADVVGEDGELAPIRLRGILDPTGDLTLPEQPHHLVEPLIERAFGEGVQTLPELVAYINRSGPAGENGEPWTEDSFQALMARLGY